MNILMLSYEYPPLGGGGSYVVYGLSRALTRLGCRVDLVTMGFRDLPAYEEVDGLRIHRVRTLRTKKSICYLPELALYVPVAAPKIRALAKQRRYDLNHTHFLLPDGLLSLYLKRSLGLRYVVTAHGSDVPGFNPDRFTHVHRLVAPIWRRVVAEAEEIVFPSRILAKLAEEAGSRAAHSIIPNGFDTSRFLDSGVSRTPNKILTVSRLFERKGVQYLFRALAGLDLPAEAHIVGTGPYLSTLRQQATDLDLEVDFHGWLNNQSREFEELLRSSAIFVFTSESENFPIVLLEAMAAGLAIVTTSGTGCEEIVGDTAILVPPKDEVALREAIRRLLVDEGERDRLGRAARQRLEQMFDWGRVAEQHLDIYERHLRQAVAV